MKGKANKKSEISISKNATTKKEYVKVEKNKEFPLWACILIPIVTTLIYSKCFNFSLTNFDDDFYINNNPYLRDFTWQGIWSIFTSFYTSNYHPFTTITYLFEYQLFGLNPTSYHVVNVILHAANTWLVFIFINNLTSNRYRAFIVASLFALHPMHVESVAWVSERKDVLYTLFYLLSLIAYVKFLTEEKRKKYYFLSFLFFIFSLFSKSAAVTLPILLLAIDYYKQRKFNYKMAFEKAPFLILSILFGILNIFAQSSGGSINSLMHSYGIINRIFLIASGIFFYLLHLLFPVQLCAMHYFPDAPNGMLPWIFYLSVPLLLMLSLIIIFIVVKNKPIRGELIFGLSFFFITISVMLQFVSFGSCYAAERYTYIPYIGLFLIVSNFITSSALTEKFRKAAQWCFMVFISICVFSTWQQIDKWQDGVVLFTDVIDKQPENYIGYWMRGNLEKEAGNLKDALEDYNKTIERNARYEDAYYNRGKILDDIGKPKDAIKDYDMAIKLNPKLADAYNNRGWANFETGDTVNALKDFDSAILKNASYAEAYNNRGWLYFKQGNLQLASNDFEKAISVKPKFIKPYYNDAIVKVSLGEYKKALTDYNNILNLNKDAADAYFYRGITNLQLLDTLSACRDLEIAVAKGYQQAFALKGKYCK